MNFFDFLKGEVGDLSSDPTKWTTQKLMQQSFECRDKAANPNLSEAQRQELLRLQRHYMDLASARELRR